MTEVQWLACDDPAALLVFVSHQASERQFGSAVAPAAAASGTSSKLMAQ
jgi:hypothetical protein